MEFKMKIGSSFSCISTSLCSPFRSKAATKLISRLQLFERQLCDTDQLRHSKVLKSCQLIDGKLTVIERLSKRRCILFATTDDQLSYSELETDDFEQEIQAPLAEASFIVPSLYLRKILSTIFEDSLLTDFLILFFTEAIFYCGVAVVLLLIDHFHLRRPIAPLSTDVSHTPHLGHRISSVAVLVLSLIIPMVTMGFVWPWTGPAASATLAPYLVGLVVQFAFEQYARHIMSPSWHVIPIIFQGSTTGDGSLFHSERSRDDVTELGNKRLIKYTTECPPVSWRHLYLVAC
ncbi:Hypothetical predicted protein [Olea europaea subsp. europaea]|uniref:Uncharacterized protein n=1 Tax=Olea europaea subsp. europaea TaxID=158383 RepID=A0A8S0P8T8_OLEEU|nr:Hypothetical predicted protein [Olea europaea subsp. europaea]